jgi:hypothetical protein
MFGTIFLLGSIQDMLALSTDLPARRLSQRQAVDLGKEREWREQCRASVARLMHDLLVAEISPDLPWQRCGGACARWA